jgi:uncharacterized protein (DUF58 family)
MLRGYWPLLTIAAVIAGIVARNPAVIALGLLVGAACWGAMLWARWSLRRLRYERILPEDHVFPGDRAALRLRITNDKSLPLTWLDATERFAPGLVALDDPEFRAGTASGPGLSDWRTSVRGHERVTRSYELACEDRGLYEIGGTRLRSGDPLGLFTDERIEERRTPVTVYPRTLPLGDLALPSRRPYGEDAGGSRLFEDPSRIMGLRDYVPGDSLRRIDWKATARLARRPGDLFVRRAFATSDLDVALILDDRDDVTGRVGDWARGDRALGLPGSMDMAREAAWSLACGYLDVGDQVAFQLLSRPSTAVPRGSGARHRERLRAAIAGASPQPRLTRTPTPLVARGALIILMSTFLDDETVRLAGVWRVAGHRMLAVDTLPRLRTERLRREEIAASRMVLGLRADRLRDVAAMGADVLVWDGDAGSRAAALRGISRPRRRR